MPDPTTTIGAGLAIWGAKDLLVKLLGPSFDYVGKEMAGLVEKCNVNLDGIFKRAVEVLGENLDREGYVNPRVTRQVLDEGPYCDEKILQEYFAGILASSRTIDGADDRGVSYARAIRGLSVFDLRTHYILYRSLRALFLNTDLDLERGEDRRAVRVFLPLQPLLECLEVDVEQRVAPMIPQIIGSLQRSALVGGYYNYGSVDALKRGGYSSAKLPGVILQPSIFGLEMYLWAHGYADRSPGEFLSRELEIDQIPFQIALPRGVRGLRVASPYSRQSEAKIVVVKDFG